MAAYTRRQLAGRREEAPVERARRRPTTALWQGFLSNALNPKVALFFVTFLPQFLSARTSAGTVHGRALLLSAVFALLYLAWFGLYITVVDGFGRLLRRPRVKAAIERVTGVLLIGFALRLATAHQ